MNDEKTNKIMSSEELDDVLPKYEPIKLSGKNLAQNYVSAFNTGMNIYQCVNYLQGNIEWVVKAVNDVVKLWNVQVGESIDQSKAIARETTTEQFNKEWTNKQPELIEQVNTLTTNQFNNEKSVFNDQLDTLNAHIHSLSNPNLLINPDFRINQRGQNTYSSIKEIYTVDRWSASNSTTIVNSDGTITISTLSGPGYFNYRSENILYGKHAYSIYVQAITGNVMVYYRNKDGSDIRLGTLKQGLNTFTPHNDDGFERLIIVIQSGASVTLKYVKVEQGTVVTPFIAPNPAEELVKCKRYFQVLNVFEGFVGSVSYWNLYTNFYVGAMRTTSPTITANVSSATINLSGDNTEKNLELSNNITPTMYLNELIITHKSATSFGFNAYTACIFRSAITYNVDAEIY